MGKKYIIELENKPFKKGNDFLHRVKGFNSLVFDQNGLRKLKELDTKACVDYLKSSGWMAAHDERVRASVPMAGDEIRIGDEVECEENGGRGIVIDSRSENSQVAVLTGNSKVYSWWCKSAIRKTGRHFPEIAEVLRKMVEKTNE